MLERMRQQAMQERMVLERESEMNVAVIIIEISIMLLVFGFLVFGLLFISPLTFISDYPPEIQETYYRTQNKTASKKKITAIMKIK